MYVGRGHGDVAQARRAEPAHVFRLSRVLDETLAAGGQRPLAVEIVEAGVVVPRRGYRGGEEGGGEASAASQPTTREKLLPALPSGPARAGLPHVAGPDGRPAGRRARPPEPPP